MPAPEIQISKDGLKLSYQRYMADSAAGFLVILIVLFSVNNKMPLPFLGHSFESFLVLSKDTKIFTLLITFILATPLGLAVNGLGWFIFGYLRSHYVNFWFYSDYKTCRHLFFTPTMKAMNFEKIKEFFRLTPQNTYELSEYYGDYLDVFFGERIGMEHVNGLSRFTRSVLLISCISFFSLLHIIFWNEEITFRNSHEVLCFCFFVAVIAFFLYSILASYSSLKRLLIFYILCISQGIQPSSPEILIKKIHAAYFKEEGGSEINSIQ